MKAVQSLRALSAEAGILHIIIRILKMQTLCKKWILRELPPDQ